MTILPVALERELLVCRPTGGVIRIVDESNKRGRFSRSVSRKGSFSSRFSSSSSLSFFLSLKLKKKKKKIRRFVKAKGSRVEFLKSNQRDYRLLNLRYFR